MDFFRGFVTIWVSCEFCRVCIPSVGGGGGGEPAPILPAPINVIASELDIVVSALGGRLALMASFSGPRVPVTFFSAIMGVYGAVRRPLRPALPSVIVGVYGDVYVYGTTGTKLGLGAIVLQKTLYT